MEKFEFNIKKKLIINFKSDLYNSLELKTPDQDLKNKLDKESLEQLIIETEKELELLKKYLKEIK